MALPSPQLSPKISGPWRWKWGMLQSTSADPTSPPVTFQFMGFAYPDERSAVWGCLFPGFDVPGSGVYMQMYMSAVFCVPIETLACDRHMYGRSLRRALVRSLRWVDAATWNACIVISTGIQGSGCEGVFCRSSGGGVRGSNDE